MKKVRVPGAKLIGLSNKQKSQGEFFSVTVISFSRLPCIHPLG